MRTTLEIMTHCLAEAIKHPRTKITQVGNPEPVIVSPIPWWGCVIIILLGIISWCLAVHWSIQGLEQVAPAMVYCPMMHLFDMSWFIEKQLGKGKK
jgi:hypothetical protein